MQIYEIAQNPNSQYLKVNQPSSINYSGLAAPGVKQATTPAATTPTTAANASGVNLKKGFWSSLGDYAKRGARNYMSSKTGLPADVFKNKKEREEEEAEAERKEIEAKIKSKLADQRRKAAIDSTLGTTPESEPADDSKVAADNLTAPTTTPAASANPVPATTAPAPALTTPVNYNIPAYQRKGQTTPATTAPTPAVSANPAPTTTAPAEPSVQKSAIGVKQINQLIPNIRTRDLDSIKKNIDAVLAKRQKPAAPASSMSSMATQLTNKSTASSSGGKTTATPTGIVHTAKPAAAPMQFKGRQAKVTAPPPAGAPTSAEYANLEQRLQQAMAAQAQGQTQ